MAPSHENGSTPSDDNPRAARGPANEAGNKLYDVLPAG